MSVEIVENDGMTDILFDCPICGSDCKFSVYGEELDENASYTCGECYNRYYLHPVESPDGSDVFDMSIEEKLSLQLRSVSEIHDIADNHYEKTIEIASSVSVTIFGGLALLMASIVLIGATVVFQDIINSDIIFAGMFTGWAIATGIGYISWLYGSFSAVYNGFILYQQYNPDYSYSEFVNYIANYHKNELL